MSCSCNDQFGKSSTGATLPSIETDYNISYPCDPVPGCTDPEALPSENEEGAQVPSDFLKTECGNENVTLLARKGSRWTRFRGSGFIQIIRGKAKLVKQISIQLTTLWHERFNQFGHGMPVIGRPLDSPYDVVADKRGGVHAQKGLASEDSLRVWSAAAQAHQTKSVADLPKKHRGLLPQAVQLELTGYAPILPGGSLQDVRDLMTLAGEGLLFLEQINTIPSDGCQCSPETGYVAHVLPRPSDDGVFSLKYNSSVGYYWSED